MRDLRNILTLVPHVSIVISGMMIVFFIIDRFNDAMGFMESDVTKVLIFILSISAITTAVLAMVYRTRLEEATDDRRRESQQLVPESDRG